jgi:hypothetical protein
MVDRSRAAEGRIVLDDRDIAQGGLIDTQDGKWSTCLFKGNGAVGRIRSLVPVTRKAGCWNCYPNPSELSGCKPMY